MFHVQHFARYDPGSRPRTEDYESARPYGRSGHDHIAADSDGPRMRGARGDDGPPVLYKLLRQSDDPGDGTGASGYCRIKRFSPGQRRGLDSIGEHYDSLKTELANDGGQERGAMAARFYEQHRVELRLYDLDRDPRDAGARSNIH